MRTAAALALTAFLLCGAAKGAEPKAISSFGDGADGWTFSVGKEFPGAQGNFAALKGEGENGAAAAWIEGAFGLGGAYTAISKPLKPALPFKELRVKLKTSDFSSLTIRLKDSSGQVHQQVLKLKDSPDWQTVTVKNPVGGTRYAHWGGAADAKWHDPLAEVSLLLEGGNLKNETKTGSALIEKVEVLSE